MADTVKKSRINTQTFVETKVVTTTMTTGSTVHHQQHQHQQQQQSPQEIVDKNSITTKKKKSKKTRKEEKENISVKSSFNKFDALQKKNILHVRSSDSSKAQEKFNGAQIMDTTNCKSCDKPVFQMEQIKAEKAIWHKNCFRCKECNKQLTVDIYESHEGNLYCKPHFKALFAPKFIEDDTPPKSRKPELIIRENQPVELPPDVVRASDKPDLGLEELQTLNMKERFQLFEQQQQQYEQNNDDKPALLNIVNVKRSQSILSKLAKFQAKGMNIGISDEHLNGIPIEESSSDDDNQQNNNDNDDIDDFNEDADLIRAKKVQKEKPFHFTGMSDVKNKWEHGNEQNSKDERREERKQEIQSIRNRLFMGKQGKMKEAYQQAVMESEFITNKKKNDDFIEIGDTKSIKERFEKGQASHPIINSSNKEKDEENEVFESEISKKSRSLFLELDANASKPPQVTPLTTPKLADVKRTREAYLMKTTPSVNQEDIIKSSDDIIDDIQIKTSDIHERFKFFETYKEPEKTKKRFRITPPRDDQIKAPTPDREIYRDPDVIRSEEMIEDSVIAKEQHITTKMLNKFRQMEEETLTKKDPLIGNGPMKPLKRFTPPPEPTKNQHQRNDDDNDDNEEEEDDNDDDDDDDEDEDGTDEEVVNGKIIDGDLLEAQKAARAKQLRAKFEKWEANEIKKEQNNTINLIEEFGDEQSQIESTKSLRARFESMKEHTQPDNNNRTGRVKVNRFVGIGRANSIELCQSCKLKVYPLEKISIHGHIYHRKCFKCVECSCILRMNAYSYNQGKLYCLTHFKRLFISKGNYDSGFIDKLN